MVTVSVPGKIHLMGEHAVVYGAPALVAAIHKRLTVRVSAAASGIHIETPAGDSYVRHILSLVAAKQNLPQLPPMRIVVTSEFPAGYHLGSSAAVAAGVIGAVTYFAKKIWNPLAINQLAFDAEKHAHGNPSGADNTAVVFGGLVWFRRELPFLKSIWQLPFRVPPALDHFYLIDTGKPAETTKEMVEYVSSKFKVQSSKLIKLFDDNEQQTKRIAAAVKEGDGETLTDALKKGSRTLEKMGVVSPMVIPHLRAIEKAGGAAKILGGGGRKGAVGYLLAYHRNEKILRKTVKDLPVEKISLGEEGIRLEEKE